VTDVGEKIRSGSEKWKLEVDVRGGSEKRK
jgi:hypothetical protein